MLKCPSCDATLDQDFGMVTCGHCKAVLMIDMSGQVQVGTDSSAPEVTDGEGYETAVDDDQTDPPEESITEPDDFEPVQTLDNEYEGASEPPDTYDDDFSEEDEFDPIESDMDQLQEADEVLQAEADVDDDFTEGDQEQAFESVEDDAMAEPLSDSTEQFHADSTEGEPEGMTEDYSDEQESNEGVAFQETPLEGGDERGEIFPMAREPDPEPVNITEFANSEASSLEEGEYLYDVKVARLDSKDLKEALKYVLIDEKLQLNHHEYLKNIRDGQVLIPNLNPIKAKRIVEQLQYYPLSITWKQKRVVIEVVEPETEEGFEEGADDGVEDVNA